MDWDGAIRRYRGIVLVLLAALPVLCACAPGPLRRAMRNAALSMLRPLESCARLLALVMVHTTMRSCLRAGARSVRGPRGRRSGGSSRSGFVLFSAGESLALLRPRLSGRRRAGGGRTAVSGTAEASALACRVAALRTALGDLPALARRLGRALAGRGHGAGRASRGRVLAEAASALRVLSLPPGPRAFVPP